MSSKTRLTRIGITEKSDDIIDGHYALRRVLLPVPRRRSH